MLSLTLYMCATFSNKVTIDVIFKTLLMLHPYCTSVLPNSYFWIKYLIELLQN